jgi:hypothetical protein
MKHDNLMKVSSRSGGEPEMLREQTPDKIARKPFLSSLI